MSNGWRDGRDPVQRRLRIATVMVMLGVFVLLAVDPSRSGDFAPLGLSIGALMILLGYEGLIKLPYIGKDRDRDDRDPD